MTLIGSFKDPVLEPRLWSWPRGSSARDCWDDWATSVSAWCVEQRLSPRDVVVLLPVGALLPVARQAWTRAVGGWMPRLETVPTLAEALAWQRPEGVTRVPDAALGPAPTLDVVLDRLLVTQALTEQAWGRQWAQRDRRAFDHAVSQVVDSAHLWVRVAQSTPPVQRAAYWEGCREALSGAAGGEGSTAGPGGRERLLLAWALEWAASSDDGNWSTDVLFLCDCKAWVGVTAGQVVVPGSESSVMLAVLRQATQAGVPVLWMNAEAEVAAGLGALAPSMAVCLDFEEEAQRAATQVLLAVNQARQTPSSEREPVALVVVDRSLVRRVRALLEGAGARVSDETGWKLSTTRAGAAVTRLLEASRPNASTEQLLDWLKSGWVQWPGQCEGGDLDAAVAALESWCRSHGLLSAWGLVSTSDDAASSASELLPQGRQSMPDAARSLWRLAHETAQLLKPVWSAGRQPLSMSLSHLAQALVSCGAWQALLDDPAGAAVLVALRLQAGTSPEPVEWPAVASGLRMDGGGLQRWVGDVLEEASFKLPPPNGGDASVDVVVTPLTRAVLRPFSAIVMPGADEAQLGAMNAVPGWVHGALSEQMGLPTKTILREAQWASFTLLMAHKALTCLCRKAEGREPLEPSPWFERWSLLAGQALTEQPDVRALQYMPLQPVNLPQPTLHGLPLPALITATSYEALRQCPYRFFAQYVLGLRSMDELEEGLDGSDFGTWLHAVLQQFHALREALPHRPQASDDQALWLQATQDVTRQQGMDRDQRRPYFLPFTAALERLGLQYLDWLAQHEGEGWRFAKAEETAQLPLEVSPEVTVRLHGQLDRLDMQGHGASKAWCVIDYKTGSLERLKQKLKQPLEDTQLAFYAALAQHSPATADATQPHLASGAIEAMYLHLDDKAVTALKHPEVTVSADAVVEGVRQDLARILAGAALPALGEGKACEYCDVRGLCRRDHWSVSKELT